MRTFTPDGIEARADVAFDVNRTTQNIGARRLHTILTPKGSSV